MNKQAKALTITIAFAIVMFLTHYIHMRFFPVGVVLYASILDAVIAVVLTGAASFTLKQFRVFNGFEVAQLLIMFLLLGYIFAISVPTVIDRSLSFYILEKIQQRGGGIREDALRQVFTDEYVREHRLVDVRLTEQIESGTVVISDGCVKLTPLGDRLARLSRLYRKNLLPKQRLLMGTYTDALTDPFRNSEMASNYRCK